MLRSKAMVRLMVGREAECPRVPQAQVQIYVAGLAAELPDGAAAALREQDRPLRFKSCFRHLRERLLCGQNVG